jgi:predicted acylesterase/phospholipase RssA
MVNPVWPWRGTSQRVSLALQGGGAHGAFTWGVLDVLLERTTHSFVGISGSSAGAVNAVLSGRPSAALCRGTRSVW